MTFSLLFAILYDLPAQAENISIMALLFPIED